MDETSVYDEMANQYGPCTVQTLWKGGPLTRWVRCRPTSLIIVENIVVKKVLALERLNRGVVMEELPKSLVKAPWEYPNSTSYSNPPFLLLKVDLTH